MEDLKRVRISGKAISVRGNDIDTDRIIPARYLKCVTFDGLGEHAFEDDRAQLKQQGKTHPYDNPAFEGAELLFVNKNFGCGSSREHAPQAIMRWGKGVKAIAGESFAEIFFGNCVALGIPCVTLSEADIQKVMNLNESAPNTAFALDLRELKLRGGALEVPVHLPNGPRDQFIEGRWDSTAELMAAEAETAATAANLPYFNGWK